MSTEGQVATPTVQQKGKDPQGEKPKQQRKKESVDEKGKPPAKKDDNEKQKQKPNKDQGKPPAKSEGGEERTKANNRKEGNQRKVNEAKPKPEEKAANAPEPVSEISSLFSHIPVVKKWSSKDILDLTSTITTQKGWLPPILLEYILNTGLDLSIDDNERCRQFLQMIRELIKEEPISQKGRFCTSLQNVIKRTLNVLNQIRIITPSIGNSVRFLKAQLRRNNEGSIPEEEFRAAMLASIDSFISDKIDDVASFLSRKVAESIVDGDVILTYGYSPVIMHSLKLAHDEFRRQFRVVVIDSRPNFNSRQLIEQMPMIDVRYVLISGLSYIMPEVSKVLIEPCGILSNNAALTPVGTAMISMVAHEFGVPVVFVCASYRFVVDVRVDALAKNEILSKDFISPIPISNFSDQEYLALLFDVTPGQYVDVVVSELGNIPVNSISTNIKYIQDSYTLYSKVTQGFK